MDAVHIQYLSTVHWVRLTVERGTLCTPNTTRRCGSVVQLGRLPSVVLSSNKGHYFW